MAFPAQRLAARTITSADVMRLARFPAIRREFSDALVQQPIAAEVTPSRVWFGLKNRSAFHPALFTLIHVGGKGTTLVIGTPKAKIKKPAALASFLRRMGWTGGRWTRVLGNKGHRDLVYQLRKANIIGGSETVAVLVPRQRVERAAGKFMKGSTRATGTNPDELSRLKRDRDRVVRVMERPMSPRVFQQLMAEVERLNRGIRRLEGRPVNVNRNPRKIHRHEGSDCPACGGSIRFAYEHEKRNYYQCGVCSRYWSEMKPGVKRGPFERGTLGNPLNDRESATLIREARRQYGYAKKAKGRSQYDHGLYRGYALGLLEVGKRFGFASAKAQRAGEHVIQQAMKNPLTREESAAILREARMGVIQSSELGFGAKSKERVRGGAWRAAQIVQQYGVGAAKRAAKIIQLRSHGIKATGYLKHASLNPAQRFCVTVMDRNGKHLGFLYGKTVIAEYPNAELFRHVQNAMTAARRYAHVAEEGRTACVIRDYGFENEVCLHRYGRKGSGSNPRTRKNPILATLGIAANPNPAVQNINIPFRDGQKVTTDRIERWIRSLPNGPLRTMYETRFVLGQKQYKRFHLGTIPKTWTWKTVPVGANKRITDVDFVVSEGKEWSAAYQVPPHSKKYTKDTQGRYLHAHGDSGIDIKTIKHPAKPSKLPERFHTADGLFVGVIPKKGSITDWYRH